MVGRALPPPSAFAGDDGSADPALAEALDRYAAGIAPDVEAVVATLAAARVLVPVVARLEADGHVGGLHVDKEASARIVALRAPDGRTALPVFSSVTAMTAWSSEARPVPALAPLAAASALEEGWEVMVVDPAGAAVVIPRPAVHALATGARWSPAVTDGSVRPDVRAEIVSAVMPVDGVVSADALPGRAAEVVVVLGLRSGLDRPGLDRVVAQAGAGLAASAIVTGAVDSLELKVVAGHVTADGATPAAPAPARGWRAHR